MGQVDPVDLICQLGVVFNRLPVVGWCWLKCGWCKPRPLVVGIQGSISTCAPSQHFLISHTFLPQAPKELGAKMLGRNWQALLSAPPDLTGKGILSIEEWQQRAQTGVVS